MHVTKTGPRPSDKYIPWYFVAFFVVLFSFDGIFVYLAVSSHRGVVEDNSYQRGLNYNDTVAASEAQAALGWHSDLVFTADDTLELQMADADGNPLRAARVTARFFRPTQAGSDFTITLDEAAGGLYTSEPINTVPGQWEVRVFVLWKQHHYQLSERILVPGR